MKRIPPCTAFCSGASHHLMLPRSTARHERLEALPCTYTKALVHCCGVLTPMYTCLCVCNERPTTNELHVHSYIHDTVQGASCTASARSRKHELHMLVARTPHRVCLGDPRAVEKAHEVQQHSSANSAASSMHLGERPMTAVWRQELNEEHAPRRETCDEKALRGLARREADAPSSHSAQRRGD